MINNFYYGKFKQIDPVVIESTSELNKPKTINVTNYSYQEQIVGDGIFEALEYTFKDIYNGEEYYYDKSISNVQERIIVVSDVVPIKKHLKTLPRDKQILILEQIKDYKKQIKVAQMQERKEEKNEKSI